MRRPWSTGQGRGRRGGIGASTRSAGRTSPSPRHSPLLSGGSPRGESPARSWISIILRPGRETDQPQAEEGSLVDIPSDIVSVHVGHSNGEHVLVGVIVVIVII